MRKVANNDGPAGLKPTARGRGNRSEGLTVRISRARGHEQAGTRPALVVSISPFNQGPAGLVIVVPITTKDKRITSHVAVNPPEGGLKHRSSVMTEAIRSISHDRVIKRLGAVA